METRCTHRAERRRSASGCGESGEGRPVRILRGRRGWLGLAVLIGSGPALGATAPVLLPPESSYLVKWYQSDGATPVASWEIEVTPVLSKNPRFVVGAQVVPELSCWSVAVPVGEASGVRIRSVAGTQVSSWTPNTSVPRPNGSYVVKWYQPHGTTAVLSWDLEITPVRDPNASYVVGALVNAERTCWALSVPVGEPSLARIRPVSGTQVATWSAYTLVPEPGFAASCGAAFAWLSGLARRRRRRAIVRQTEEGALSAIT